MLAATSALGLALSTGMELAPHKREEESQTAPEAWVAYGLECTCSCSTL